MLLSHDFSDSMLSVMCLYVFINDTSSLSWKLTAPGPVTDRHDLRNNISGSLIVFGVLVT